ncbi:MAG: phosphopantetheine-binding protein, partial [Jatrophihabitantaceae bacterium]
VLGRLAAIWADLLQRDPPAAADDFFDLGGDSLFAIRLIGRIRTATGVKLSLKDIFSASTLGAQAALLGARIEPAP